ncbi:major facilitator superfamily domain-containing protein [Penicillium rubens]|uniref:Major facilitator superfamily domain-containing protein n=1 Tax=Penicillium chrysogenum TaxID=5076 RepID=A0ABQ8WDN1_PENCH|nr:major facilitator superfamily domain-containing protein [Penicillium chrysogenum]KAJ5849194.1 major facilitator superfamily domain-containing protein [Penicillium rubens]
MPVPHQSLELELMDSTVSTDNISAARHNKSEEPEEPIPDTRVAAIGHVEAYHKVLYHTGPSGRRFLFTIIVSLGLTMFAYALDQGITPQFNLIAASSFSRHAQLGVVTTASTLISGIVKPLIGKLADLTSRPTTYIISLVFYVVGVAIAASCTKFVSYIVGAAFTSVGKAGLNLLGQITVGDLTTLQWRGFWTSLTIAPYLVTVFINGSISNAFIPHEWRWGIGMFAIMIPGVLIPAIAALYATQHRARAMGIVRSYSDFSRGSIVQTAWDGLVAVDLPGLVLLGLSFSLILLPLSLAQSADNGWSNPSMIAMEVVGFVALALFIAFEIYAAPKPIMTKSIIQNKVFLAGLGANLFDQMTTALSGNYFPSYIYVIKDWDNYTWTIFIGCSNLAVTVFSLLAGYLQARQHRYRNQMIVGAVLKTIGYAICITGKRSTQNTAPLAVSQILLGASALTALGSRVGAMASVPHEDMASLIAAYFLWTYLGTAAGYAIASSFWTGRMLDFMREELPDTPEETLREIYGSVEILRTKYEVGSIVREGAIRAYARTNGIIFITASVISVLSLLCSVFMPGKT